MTELVHTKEKTTSAFVAAALGDAMGWPFEAPRKGEAQRPGSWSRLLGSRFAPIQEEVRHGEYSDDTQLILSVTRSLLRAGPEWPMHFAQIELPAWRLYERGGGRATKTAAELFSLGRLPWDSENLPPVQEAYFAAGGNGAAMRILPHVAFRVSKNSSPRELCRDVFTNSIITHGHPRAIIGALVHAFAIDCAFRKTTTLGYGEIIHTLLNFMERFELGSCADLLDESWLKAAERFYGSPSRLAKTWNETVGEIAEMLIAADDEMKRGPLAAEAEFLRKIGALTRATNGAGTVSAVAAVFLASRYATDPMAGLRTASQIPGLDSDTVASMCGSILAGINGSDWMGSELLGLQDVDYIRRLASQLSVEAEISSSWTTARVSLSGKVRSVSKRNLGEFTAKTTTELPLIGNVSVEEVRVLRDRKQTIAISVAVVKAFDGQTLFIYGSQKKQKAPVISEPSVPKTGVRFYTNNLRAIRSFYEDILDWRPETVTKASVVYSPNIVFADSKDSGADLLLTHSSDGQALIMEVKDFESFRKRLAAKNVGARNDWFVRKSSRPMLVLHDPDGRRVEVFAAKS